MPHFRVTYAVSAPDESGARAIVDALCLEQTVELPLALVPPGTWINEHVVAKCESLRRVSQSTFSSSKAKAKAAAKAAAGDDASDDDVRWEAVVRYSDDTAGGELPQLLNVIFGNTSIKENVMVTDLSLSPTLLGKFLGPRFGTQGLREVCGVPKGPMLMTALKPMGSSVAKLAEMAYAFAKGGIDIIKDDHGLANQRYAPYEERVRACAAAVRRANAETGRKCVYAPCLNAPAHLVVQRAKFAKAAGAGAVLMIPGITGLDTMRVLAEDPDFNLPVICHPAILGAMLGGGSTDAVRGFSHKVLLGILPRLAGADATIFPNFGGRFGFSVDECKGILKGCTEPMGSMPAIMPSPGGGMTMEKVKAMGDVYGDDVLLLIGGSLIGHSPDLVANAKFFLNVAGRKDLYGPLETGLSHHHHPASSHPPPPPPPPHAAAAAAAAAGAAAPSTPEARELAALKKQYAAMEAKLEQLASMVSSGGGGGGGPIGSPSGHGGAAGTTLPPGVNAPHTPVEGNYSKVFNRAADGSWNWERIPQEMYKQDGGSFKGCSRYELLGKRGESTVFHVRYFEVEPGGWTTLEHHRHEHAVIGLRGAGEIQLGPHVYPVAMGDCAYTAPGDTHQLRNPSTNTEPFGFICVVAADRDRPIEVDPKEFLTKCGLQHALQHGMKEALEGQAKHRAAHATAAGGGAAGAVADGSACEWKPGMGKMKKAEAAAAAVEEGSACEWKPKSKR